MDRKMPSLTTDCQIAGLSRRQQLVPERFPVSERFPKETKVSECFPKEKETKVSERFPKEVKLGWRSPLRSANQAPRWRHDLLCVAEDALCAALGAGSKHRQPSASARHRPSDPPQVTLRLVIFLGEGLHYQPGSAARPPKNHGPGPRGLRAHAVSTHPQLVRPPHPAPQRSSRRRTGRRDLHRRRTRRPSCLRRSLEHQTH